jgi:hypothetical protein
VQNINGGIRNRDRKNPLNVGKHQHGTLRLLQSRARIVKSDFPVFDRLRVGSIHG